MMQDQDWEDESKFPHQVLLIFDESQKYVRSGIVMEDAFPID